MATRSSSRERGRSEKGASGGSISRTAGDATTHAELLDRKQAIEDRLDAISIPQPPAARPRPRPGASAGSKKRTRRAASPEDLSELPQVPLVGASGSAVPVPVLPYVPKTDVHWDFVLKELMWLGTDFSSERKRQIASAKKLGASVLKFHASRETRRLRRLQQAESKRKKVASKLGRDVKGWWTKLEKIVAYQQKQDAEKERQTSMNKQLVKLVQQTEKYTESLSNNTGKHRQSRMVSTEEEGDTDTDEDSGGNRIRSRRPRDRAPSLTIEEALASASHRKAKSRYLDYSRMKLEETEFYGESTADEGSGSNLDEDEYSPSDEEEDSYGHHHDEATLQLAMEEEMNARAQRSKRGRGKSGGPSSPVHDDALQRYSADPEELRKLDEEKDMDIAAVLKRLQTEGEEATEDEHEVDENDGSDPMETDEPQDSSRAADGPKQVRFGQDNSPTEALAQRPRAKRSRVDPGEDADDDGDASDVEDYLETLHEEYNDENESATEEYFAKEPEPDDETTLIAEEKLGRDMTYEEELEILNRENEMSIDELRAMYAGMAEKSFPSKGTFEPRENDGANSDGSGRSAPNDDGVVVDDDDGEFEADRNEVDDETTMIAEEKLGRDMTYEEELALLNRENEMSIEELRAMYAGMDQTSGTSQGGFQKNDMEETDDAETDGSQSASNDDDDDDDGEFEADKNEVDDETTMIAEERLGRDMTYKEELELLNRENEMSIEELRAMYAGMNESEENPNNHGIADDVNNDETGDNRAKQHASGQQSNSVVHDDSDAVASASDDDGEFEADNNEVDDETTMIAEEKLGRDMTYEEELKLLNQENEMSVDELRAMYSGIMDTGTICEVDSEGQSESSQKMSIRDDKDRGDSDEKIVDGGCRKRRKRNRATTDGSSLSLDSKSGGIRKRIRNKGNTRGGFPAVAEDEDEKEAPPSSEPDGTAAMKALAVSAAKARETLASRPFLLAPWVKLRKYQQIGLNWLVSLQSRRLNGILADEMGLGKTLQTISLLAYLASYKGIWGPHLVIVPTSVIINWETELKRFCPGFKILCYYGNAKRRKELRTGWTKANWYHVVITSYQLAVQDAFAFKRKKWYYLILDEAQNIKNFQSQRWQTLINFNTQRRLLLTGTPLQNNLMELWSLLHFLMPYIFKSRKEFSYWFSNPMNNIIEGTANQNADVIKRLHGIIRPFVLRRLKKEVEKQMPGKFEHIVKCQLSRRQMTLYEEFLSRSSTRQALKQGGNFMGMMNVLMQLRKVCNHPDLFEPRSVVTPFVLPSISIAIPRCTCEIWDEDDAFLERISSSMAKPLWCGSSSKPSVEAALHHDSIESAGLSSVCAGFQPREKIELKDDESSPTELQSLVKEIYRAREEHQASTTKFQNAINRRRCKARPFPYSSKLLNALEVECNIFRRAEPTEVRNQQVIETPAKLLELRKSERDRAIDMEQTIEKFVFRVPPAGGRPPKVENGIPTSDGERAGISKDVERMLLEPIEEILEPYRKARARLSSFFPDKKLVQYDAGKLQALATLLRKRKEGGHKCLIFTQMGKVLDVLEAFLSMNGHTYLRLDGSTGVDKRQRLMDRFNNDPKVFCFILSTRSGGTGINLTGADTVIFYDSDWNPAMDAQAQDRAHRIGQTRDVHIYRLITEHTIEENILKKAQKKKNLDIMVMDQGKFNASTPSRPEDSNKSEDVKDVYTKAGLQAILGFEDDEPHSIMAEEEKAQDMSKDEMEEAMAALEDEDDAKALRGAQKETEEDQKEFDENTAMPMERSDDDEGDPEKAKGSKGKRNSNKTKRKGGKESQQEGDEQNLYEKDLEKEFAAWQSTEGFDAKDIGNFLSPMERYGLKFREEIDPFYSIFYINEQRRKMEATEGAEEIDMDAVEQQKALEEQQAIDNQDLLATGTRPEDLVRQRNLYRREKIRLRSEKLRRKITGELWSQKVDGLTKKLFWYNEETGEATWDTPSVVADLEAEEVAIREGWGKLPTELLTRVMGYLVPFPERQSCSAVCRQWKVAAKDIRFVIHVYPVEMGALANRDPSKRHYNHYATIADALANAHPGDTIELGDGHYWVNDPGILIDKPLRFVGDENNPANVVIEMSGSVQWTASGGWIEGITFRRPKMSSGGKSLPSHPMLEVSGPGRVDMIHSVFDNDGSTGPVARASGSGTKGLWRGSVFRNGGSSGMFIDGSERARAEFIDCTFKGNRADGLFVTNKARVRLSNCTVENNQGSGMRLATTGCHAEVFDSRFKDNTGGVIKKETHCVVTSSSNTAFLKAKPKRQIPGFKLMVLKHGPVAAS